MNRRWISLGARGLLAYGHYGRPLLAFPSQEGNAGQYKERGMIDALRAPA